MGTTGTTAADVAETLVALEDAIEDAAHSIAGVLALRSPRVWPALSAEPMNGETIRASLEHAAAHLRNALQFTRAARAESPTPAGAEWCAGMPEIVSTVLVRPTRVDRP